MTPFRYRRRMRFLRPAVLLSAASVLWAWNAAGHKTVAFIAYTHLTARARANVDRLLESHPDYAHWVEGVPTADLPLAAFLRASVWADEIKGDPNYSDEPRDAAPSREYPDHFRHRNWHYIDTPLTGPLAALLVDAANTTWGKPPNAVSQIAVMEKILRNRTSTPAAKAWALGWLIHLVGDLHQPLHCVSRDDDQGGNRVHLNGKQHNLHAFWDDSLGEDASTASVRALGTDLIAAADPNDGRAARLLNPNQWVREGSRLSIDFVYRGLADAPSTDGALTLPLAYRRTAEGVAARRATLGGERLAALLNKLLGH